MVAAGPSQAPSPCWGWLPREVLCSGCQGQALALSFHVVLLCEIQRTWGPRMRRGWGCSRLPTPCQKQEKELEVQPERSQPR